MVVRKECCTAIVRSSRLYSVARRCVDSWYVDQTATLGPVCNSEGYALAYTQRAQVLVSWLSYLRARDSGVGVIGALRFC